MPDIRPPSYASLPPFDERLRRLLERAAGEIRASRAEIERAAACLEAARRLIAGGHVQVRPLTYELPPYPSSAPSRSKTSGRSHRHAYTAPSRRHGARRPPPTGARLPCTRTGCRGTMQFGRELVWHGETIMTSAGRGWVCSERAKHVHLARGRHANRPPSGLTARARWEDDGGSRR
jgi:hypothetical protein